MILRVPIWPARRCLPLFRIASASAAAVATLAVLALALHPAPQAPAAPEAAAAAAPSAASAGTNDPGFIDDPVARLKRELQIEFPSSQFTCSLQPRPFFIALEHSGRFAGPGWTDDFARGLELASTVFQREIADRLGLRPVKDTLLPVLVLESRNRFDRYCERQYNRTYGPDVKGFYEYSRQRIVTYQDEVLPRDVLLHEGTHQLIHHYLLRETQGRRVSVTYWIQEGLGCYFEPFHRRVDGEVGPDRRLENQRLAMLKQVLGRPDCAEFVPLARLVGMTVDGMFDTFGPGRADDAVNSAREAKFCYAESWALVHFLRQAGPGHRKVFDAILRRELAGTASREAFEQIVRDELGLDLYQFEGQFVKYILALP